MIWDIDLIFGKRVSNHKLQINFEIHSGLMIFGQLTDVGLWNLVNYSVVTTFFMSPPLSGRYIECYPCPSFRNSEIKKLSALLFAMLWDINLIFDMWVYNDKLEIKFMCRSGPIIFCRVMALGLWNLANYLLVTILFHYDWRYWLDFWHENVQS